MLLNARCGNTCKFPMLDPGVMCIARFNKLEGKKVPATQGTTVHCHAYQLSAGGTSLYGCRCPLMGASTSCHQGSHICIVHQPALTVQGAEAAGLSSKVSIIYAAAVSWPGSA